MEGDPEVGKSFLSLAIVTAYTTGSGLPPDTDHHEPQRVLLLTAEDGLPDTVRPRLEDMGADLHRVTVLKAIRDDEGTERSVDLGTDVSCLEAELATGGYGLVIIDPINAYLPGVDSHKDTAIRSVLSPLSALAERWGVTVIVIRHLTKVGRDRAIYRGQGTIGYAAAARVVMLVGRNPENPYERVVAVIKNNLALHPASIAFEIGADGQFFWCGETAVTADALLAPEASIEQQSAQAESRDFLTEILDDGPVESDEVLKMAKAVGLAERTVKRAKASLHIKARRIGKPGMRGGGVWAWELPSTSGLPVIKRAKDANKENPAPLINSVSDDASKRDTLGTLNISEEEPAAIYEAEQVGEWRG